MPSKITSSNSRPGSSHSTSNASSSPLAGSRSASVATPFASSRRYASTSGTGSPLTVRSSQPGATPAAWAGEPGSTALTRAGVTRGGGGSARLRTTFGTAGQSSRRGRARGRRQGAARRPRPRRSKDRTVYPSPGGVVRPLAPVHRVARAGHDEAVHGRLGLEGDQGAGAHARGQRTLHRHDERDAGVHDDDPALPPHDGADGGEAAEAP